MAIKGTYHNHTTWSDGVFTPEALVKRAIELGFQEVGITDHFFTLKGGIKYVKTEQIKSYLRMLRGLRKKYNNKIKIFAGLEIDTTMLNPYRLSLPYDQLNKLDYVLFEYIDDGDTAEKAKRVMLQSYIQKMQSEITAKLIAHGASKIGALVKAQLRIKEDMAIQERIKQLTETKAILTLETLIAMRKKFRCHVGLAHPKLLELISLYGAEQLARMLATNRIFVDICGSAKNARRSFTAIWHKHRPFYLHLEGSNDEFRKAALKHRVSFVPSSDTHKDDENDRMIDTLNAIEVINGHGFMQKTF